MNEAASRTSEETRRGARGRRWNLVRRTRGTRDALAQLEREEQRTVAELKHALVAAGEDLPVLADVRALARRHPGLTIAASAALGVALAPLLGRLARAALPTLLKELRSGGAGALAGFVSFAPPPADETARPESSVEG